MDILHLVDRLESLITSSRMVPFSVYRLVDEDRALELIDQMRISIPEEVKQAKRVHQERDRIIAQAHEEAGRLVELARDEAEALVQRDVITATAERRAQTVIERAQREALGLKAESDEYVVQALSELEASLMRTLTVVRNGLEKIEREKQQAADQAAKETAEIPE
jgi:vacuolar-type H+-ATPase subunit H